MAEPPLWRDCGGVCAIGLTTKDVGQKESVTAGQGPPALTDSHVQPDAIDARWADGWKSVRQRGDGTAPGPGLTYRGG
jgi:hypothetical protein